MKKIALLLLALFSGLILVACTQPEPTDPPEETVTYTVTFNSDGGTAVSPVEVLENTSVDEPADPSKAGYTFVYWYSSDIETGYDFSTLVTADLVLTAKWEVVPEPPEEKTNAELIAEDIAAIEENFVVNRYYVNTPSRGPINNSSIRWSSANKYISENGVILPVLPDESEDTGTLDARFTLNGTVVNHAFEIELTYVNPVVIENERVVPFRNVTTEYQVADSDVTLLFEANGQVPYIKVEDFFAILPGFIDPEVELSFVTEGHTLTVSYQHIDEEEHQAWIDNGSNPNENNGIYDLILIVNADDNTLTTPDPGFYWAYGYSTATNYSRHINYDRYNEDTDYQSGTDLIYDLDLYNLDVVMYEGEIVIPYYIANQLFAGSSYYNVYYNYDGLYGIYSLPSEGTDEYNAIRTSSQNGKATPADLMVHTFNYLAFSLDYFYGLQEIMNVETYYDVLFASKDKLLNDSALGFENGLFELINKKIDEPHTSYGYPGYFNSKNYTGPTLIALSQLGPRVQGFYSNGLYAVDDAIAAKWGITSAIKKDEGINWAYQSQLRQLYFFLDEDKTSVVLSLDGFQTSDIEEDTVWNSAQVLNVLNDETVAIPSVQSGSKYFYYNSSTQDYDALEILVKGLNASALGAYKASLTNDGFTFNPGNATYSKTIGAFTYYVAVDYNETYGLFYVGVVKLDAELQVTDQLNVLSGDAFALADADSAVYMEIMLEKISSLAPQLKNIILDLTMNTGGNVGALYRVVGFITSEPFRVSNIDGDTNTYSSSYVYIEGVPVYEHLNWALLTSPATFSAANSMATIFMENNLGPIIGQKSGGGASSITPILLPNGTAFTMSSNNINAYRVGGSGTEEDPYQYESNEFGITPDYAVSVANFYNNQTLLNILNEVYPGA